MIETEKKPEIKISHTQHNEDEYSISLEIEDRHVSLSTYGWSHKQGYMADVSIFDLSVDEIQKLGEALITEALRIKTA